MAWIEVHTNLPDHPKVLRAAKALKLDSDALVGKLIRLWTWALENREDGIINDLDVDRLFRLMNFDGDNHRLLDVMVEQGLLDDLGDGSYSIHDWMEHVEMLMDKREKRRKQTADRVKRYRERQKQQTAVDVTQNSVTCNALHERYSNADVTQKSNACNARTVPNRTVPYLTVPDKDIKTDTTTIYPAREEPELSTDFPHLSEKGIIVSEIWRGVMGDDPTIGDIKLLLRHSVGMEMDAIRYALDLACLYGAENPAAYATAVLNQWNTLGINTEDAARTWRGDAVGL